MSKRLDSRRFLAEKREQRRLKRIALERKKKARHAKAPLLPRFSQEPLSILKQHLPANLRRSRRYSSKETIVIPESFSMISDPESALRKIYEFVAITDRLRPPREIVFDHSRLKQFDLAAEEILDVMALGFRRAYRRRNRPIVRYKGVFPHDETARRFTKALGLVKHLELAPWMLTAEEEADLRILKFQSYKHLLRISESSPTERAAEALVNYFNSCLAESRVELTDAGRHQLALYASEVLDNAKEHSGTGDWVLVGYLDLTTPRKVCEITIFNFGLSYAETFSALDPQHFTRQFVDPFVERHEKAGYFHRSWTRDSLFTVAALQGQVSSKNNSAADTRGNGTIDLIQFFQRARAAAHYSVATNTQMAIITGSTYILFDGTHEMRPDGAGRQIIAFNATNDLEKPPDKSHVRCLDDIEFPGAIVSIRFPLPDNAIQDLDKNDGRPVDGD